MLQRCLVHRVLQDAEPVPISFQLLHDSKAHPHLNTTDTHNTQLTDKTWKIFCGLAVLEMRNLPENAHTWSSDGEAQED